MNNLVLHLPSLEILDTYLGEDEILTLTNNMSHNNLQILKTSHQSLSLINCFRLNCSKFVNVCFHECSHVSDDVVAMLPFYFYCGGTRVTDINMSFCAMRLIEVQVLSHDLRDNGICTRLSLID